MASIDTSAMPVNHCSQSTAFGALNRKHVEHAENHMERTEKHVKHAGKGKRPRKPSSKAEQQRNVNSAGTSLLMVEKIEGLIIAVLARAGRLNDAPRSITNFLFPVSSLNEGLRTAKPGSEHVVDPMIKY